MNLAGKNGMNIPEEGCRVMGVVGSCIGTSHRNSLMSVEEGSVSVAWCWMDTWGAIKMGIRAKHILKLDVSSKFVH